MVPILNGNDYFEDFKKTQKYLRSEENKLSCQPYVHECQRLAEVANQYRDKCHLLYNELSSNVVKYEYSSGGEVLHRGYYCPSPILDIVVGNGNRGKLLKTLTAKSKPTYKYGFDSQNELVVVNVLHLDESEIIIRQGNTETGVWFSKDFDINVLSESYYHNNQISSYIFCRYNSFENHVFDYRKEEYRYSAEGLEVADIFRFFNDKKAPILQHEQYHFQHDDEGYLSKYTVAEYDGEFVKDSMWQDHVYSARIKRKV